MTIRTITALGALLLLAGCLTHVTPEQIRGAVDTCSSYGGLDYIYETNGGADKTVWVSFMGKNGLNIVNLKVGRSE